MSIREDLEQLQDLRKTIGQMKGTVERLRESAGLRGARLDGMPHGSGPYDRIGELVPEIISAEEKIQALEKDFEVVRDRVFSWINSQEDIRANLILSLRYLDGMGWNAIGKECSIAEGTTVSGDSVRMFINRYIKDHE